MPVGATFRNDFPDLAAEPASPDAAPRTPILVVDDDSRNLLALSEVLGDIAEVVCANSGEEALRHLLRRQFAVILLDVLMPGMDGYETARLVRQREQSRDTPIIFLTAINKEDAHLLKGYDSGAVDYVFKPMEPLIVRSKVSVFVSLYEKNREIAEKAATQAQLARERLEAQLERTRAIEALRASEEREALLLRSLPLALYVREDGADGRLRFAGGNIETITGFAPEAFERDPDLWRERIHPEDTDKATRPGRSGEHTAEFRWLHASGVYRHLLDQSVPLPGQGGSVAGTIRDITEQHRLQEQLQQSQKMDALGKLTGGIAHDFNNLLASVLSGVSILERRGALDQRSQQVVEMTRHAVMQGKQLVERMLAFSRRQSLSPRDVDLQETCRALDGLLTPILGGLVTLEWDIGDDLWPVFVDRAQLELAVMNLVLNARDAMPEGGVVTIGFANRTIEVAMPDLAAGDYVAIRVADTGTGIPPDIVSKVVEPFFTTKDVGKGTGLGLSTAYGFARQSGGTLRIDSVVGEGTRVEIWLPRARTMQVEAPRITDDRELAAEATDLSILLIDDSESLRDFTESELADRGFKVTIASGGADALRIIETAPDAHDVIVTDYAMPTVSGLDVIRFARKVRADYPAVIITGYADTGAMAGRPADVPLVMKPFSTSELLGAIAAVVRRD